MLVFLLSVVLGSEDYHIPTGCFLLHSFPQDGSVGATTNMEDGKATIWMDVGRLLVLCYGILVNPFRQRPDQGTLERNPGCNAF